MDIVAKTNSTTLLLVASGCSERKEVHRYLLVTSALLLVARS